MEAPRVEAYMRASCSVLDFDLGELWIANKQEGGRTSLKFIQLYSSPTFEDFHSLLVQPEISSASPENESKHAISPVICRSVCDDGKIVWANAKTSGGFTGRSEVPLSTAVGVPICTAGQDTYILVLFAVEGIPMTPRAVDYLMCVVRAVAMRTGGSTTAPFTSHLTSQNALGQQCDLGELSLKYAADTDAKILPSKTQQKKFDENEALLFCEVFHDYKLARKGNFTDKQLDSLRDALKLTSRSRARRDAGAGVTGEDGPTSEAESERSGTSAASGSSSASAWSVDHAAGLKEHSESKDAGVYCADDVPIPSASEIQSLQMAGGTSLTLRDSSSSGSSESGGENSPRNVMALLRKVKQQSAQPPSDSLLHIYAHMSYRLSQCRFHEFMISMLGMTVFDSAELWLLSDRSSELHLMAAVYRTATMQKWTSSGISLRLQIGTDVPGRVMSTEQICWDPNYCDETVPASTPVGGAGGTSSSSSSGAGASASHGDFSRLRPARNGPRMSFAKELGIHTAFGVPVPGMRGPCGVLVFYSTRSTLQLDPLMVQLVENAVQIMANVSVDSLAFAGDSSASSGSDRIQEARSQPIDFNMRLHLCRSIVSGKKMGTTDPSAATVPVGLAALIDLARVGSALNYHPTIPANGNAGSNVKLETAPSNAAARSSTEGKVAPTSQVVPGGEDTYSDADVLAARTLANFGTFQWSTFLEGSGMDDAGESGKPVKYGADKILDMYASDWAGAGAGRKRKAGPADGAADGEGLNMTMCLVAGCGYIAESAESPYCATHRGTRRCQKEGCGKCAQGATKYCIAHGGGRRCTYPGCFKGARDKLFCAAHGGGKRCTFESCSKSAVGGSSFCTAHGGGKRCKFEGCSKSSQSSTDYCVKHGGGRSCIFKGCNKVARGKTDFCAAHGGGIRCKAKGCYKIAVGATSLCRMHSSAQAAAAAAANPAGSDTHLLNSLVIESEKQAREGLGSSSGDEEDDSDDMNEAEVLYGRSMK